MEEHNINSKDAANHASDSLHVVVNLDQNVIAVCTETGEIKNHANSSDRPHEHFLRRNGAAKRKRQQQLDDSSIWLYDIRDEDFEDEENGKIGVVECNNIGSRTHVDKMESRGDREDHEKVSRDEDQTQLPCTKCGESFRFADMFKHHKCIDINKNKTCELCNFNYSTTRQYNTHLQTHLESRSSVTCPLCDKVFKKRPYLMTHLRSHSQHRLYQCPDCDKEFIHFNQFKLHEVVHLDARPVQRDKDSKNIEKECQNEQLENQNSEHGIQENGKGFHDAKKVNGQDESQSKTEFDVCVTTSKRRKLTV